MITSPVNTLPAPLNLVADNPCMLALMGGFEKFQVDFFLMGDVAAYCQAEAEKRQTEPSMLEGVQQPTPLQANDWAIFISDWVPYAELNEWLVEHKGFTFSEHDNPFYLCYSSTVDSTPVKVALIPFSEIQHQEKRWVSTGFGMAQARRAFDFEFVLDYSPIQLSPYSCKWAPVTLPELMVLKLLGFVPDEPFLQSTTNARDVSSIIVNYQHLEHPHVFLFNYGIYLEAHEAADDSKLALLKCNAQVLGRQIMLTVQDDENAGFISDTLYSEDFHPFLQNPKLEKESETMQAIIALAMSRPDYYGDLTVLNHETCHELLYSMGYGLHGH